MMQAFLVFLGGGLGAVARWAFGMTAARWLGTAWPWGTFGVNVLGSFVMGIAMATLMRGGAMTGGAENWRLFLATGILGGFTTFSAFSLESARMIEAGHWSQAGLYGLTSVGISIAALFAGMALGRLNG
ncbi:MAG: fluoride efflux transporter CrcB [Hyphomonadaceae bacterium]